MCMHSVLQNLSSLIATMKCMFPAQDASLPTTWRPPWTRLQCWFAPMVALMVTYIYGADKEKEKMKIRSVDCTTTQQQ